MKKNKKIFYTLIFLCVITSCTKVINLKLGNASGQLVIEGGVINTVGPQTIQLTRNVPFSNTNTYPPVTGATVTISDQNGNIYKLPEGPLGTYAVYPFEGMPGEKYTMNVQSGNQTYTASSTMPALVALDSISAQNSPFPNSKNQRQISAYYQDPAGTPNQYLFNMYVNSTQVNSIFAFNDDFSDGKYVTTILFQNDLNMYPGDTVTVEMQCIDKPIYNYWFTQMQQENNGPGGSVTPSNPPTNITPAALGYFSAHTTQTRSIILK